MKRVLGIASVGALYLVLAVVATYPLAFHAADRVFGPGTPPLNIWAMAWVNHQLFRDPLRLFDGNCFYPYARSLAFSEHLFVPALAAGPFIALTGNPVLAHNVVSLLTLAVAGLGMYLLCREVTGDAIPSFAGGLLYAFHTWNVNELTRIQIISNAWFPFLLLALVRFFRKPAVRASVAAGVFYALQGLSCMYWALYLPLVVAPTLVYGVWRHRPSPRKLIPLALALGLAFALTALFAIPYVENGRELGFERSPPESVPIGRYADVLPGNWLYAGILGTARANQNAAHFLGFVALGVGFWGLVRGGRARGGEYRILFAALAALGFLLSLGPEIRWGDSRWAAGPYALLYRWAPGFRSVRYPERLSLLLVLGLAPLVALGLSAFRRAAGTSGTIALTALLFLEHLSIPLPLDPLPTGNQVPTAHRWLATAPDVRVVAEVPSRRYYQERFDGLPMYLSTFHWRRTLQGFTGYFPPAYNFIRWRLFHFPHPESVRFLQRLGVDTVVVHPVDGRLPLWALAEDAPDSRRRRALFANAETLIGPFPEGHLVVRLKDAEQMRVQPPEPDPSPLHLLDPSHWRAVSSRTNAGLATDRDPATAWTTVDAQLPGDFFRIELAEPAAVARVSMAIPSPYEFPMSLELRGEGEAGWVVIPFDGNAAYDGLFASLLFRPQDARLDVEMEPMLLRRIEIRVKDDDRFQMPWTMSEVYLYSKPR